MQRQNKIGMKLTIEKFGVNTTIYFVQKVTNAQTI